jgi:RNA polymerase sigma-70 factor (sigma-E family)
MVNRDEFDHFVGQRSRALLRTAHMLTHNWAAAEDLLQDAMAKAWFAWQRIAGDPEPYVRRILVTSFISQARRLWHREMPADDVNSLVDAARGAGELIDHTRAEQRLELWAALGRLPARQRAVVVLRYYEDLAEEQVALIMGCSVGTVKSQAAKALVKLRVDPAIASGSDEREERACDASGASARSELASPAVASKQRTSAKSKAGTDERLERACDASGASARSELASPAVASKQRTSAKSKAGTGG